MTVWDRKKVLSVMKFLSAVYGSWSSTRVEKSRKKTSALNFLKVSPKNLTSIFFLFAGEGHGRRHFQHLRGLRTRQSTGRTSEWMSELRIYWAIKRRKHETRAYVFQKIRKKKCYCNFPVVIVFKHTCFYRTSSKYVQK